MFLKRLEKRKNGKSHTYWAWVESIRTARGSRHRVVAHLGELKKRERNGWAHLCRRLIHEERPQPSLFDSPRYDQPDDAHEPVLVKLMDIRLERLRDFGDVWLTLGLWRLLKLDVLLYERMEAGAEDVPWPVVAAILAFVPKLAIGIAFAAVLFALLTWASMMRCHPYAADNLSPADRSTYNRSQLIAVASLSGAAVLLILSS